MNTMRQLNFVTALFFCTALFNGVSAVAVLFFQYLNYVPESFVFVMVEKPEALIGGLLGAIACGFSAIMMSKGSHVAKRALALFSVIYVFQTGVRLYLNSIFAFSVLSRADQTTLVVTSIFYFVLCASYLLSFCLLVFGKGFAAEIDVRHQSRKATARPISVE